MQAWAAMVTRTSSVTAIPPLAFEILFAQKHLDMPMQFFPVPFGRRRHNGMWSITAAHAGGNGWRLRRFRRRSVIRNMAVLPYPATGRAA